MDLFRVELTTNTRTLESGLVTAERDQTPGRIEPLMRAAHSIKGAARIVGLNTAVTLAHAMEDVLSAAQQGKRPLTPDAVDRLLKGNDFFAGLASLDISELPAALEKGTDEIQVMAGQLREFLSAPPEAVQATPPPVAAVAAEMKTVPAAPCVPSVAAPTVISQKPVPQPTPDASIQDVASAGPSIAPPAVRNRRTQDQGEGGLVRVRAENMNRLMALAGECLVQAQSVKTVYQSLLTLKKDIVELEKPLQLSLESRVKDTDGVHEENLKESLIRAAAAQQTISQDIVRFERFSRRLEHLAHRLYNEVISSRMVPFSDGLHGFSRMVRDLARETGKQIKFEIAGAATPVDRDILERLEAPLSHLIRNAIDHGMETPLERQQAGKAAEGTIILEARHVAGMLNITLADDGRGINPEDLRGKVVEKGYVTPDMAGSLSRAELFEFLFLPGFSTAKAVTEISGRGVGLDVVFNMAHEVGGTVRVDAEAGHGARFHLQLPLTLSVLRTLLLSIADEPYALPLSRIDRVLSLTHADIKEIEDRPYCTLDGEHVGILDARQLFQLPQASAPSGRFSVVIISDRLNRYGLVVDDVIGEENLVVRPLDSRLGKIPNVSAGAILDDGSPVVIFDVDDLVRSIHQLLTTGKLQKIGKSRQALQAGKKRVLIVDDSLTVREVERRLLDNAGYEVTTAVDGVDGWNTLKTESFDLLISDVDMPRMNGIDLVRTVKTDPLLREMPVMIVSYKDREEDRLRGLEAGANYYLTKGSFHDESLLTAVRDLIGGP
ncbi:MAG: hybrid sensor histidine kinase/response regulator [Deltaproteobacteria bacterium HGW-Deltaproteobacteria-6]|nr:MAG: hybrid sensor histidine kinase/response regulator [Deltaproteobacteria bacterium HGW-Deltaproteobacteria-6]